MLTDWYDRYTWRIRGPRSLPERLHALNVALIDLRFVIVFELNEPPAEETI